MANELSRALNRTSGVDDNILCGMVADFFEEEEAETEVDDEYAHGILLHVFWIREYLY